MTFKEKIIWNLLQPIHKATVFAMGIYTLTWGVWLASPFWDVFPHAQIFSTMGLFAPEVFWGCFALTCGILILWASIRQSIKSLQRGALVAWFHWTMIAIFYFIGDWQNTGGITCAFIAAYAGFVWLNMQVNSKYYGLKDKQLLR